MRSIMMLLGLLLLGGFAFSAVDSMGDPSPKTQGGERYRAGDYASAATLWEEALEQTAPGPERGRMAYNLGNTAYRRGHKLEAVGWYTAALRYLPRDGDLFANLELARAEADLAPADGGGLTDMLRRLMGKFTEAESRWLALLGVLLLALALAGEALRGGPNWRMAVYVGLVGIPLCFAPWVRHALETPQAFLVVRSGGVGGRSEPRPDAKRLARLEAGSVVQVFDELPRWRRAILEDGREVWVEEDALFELHR
ncbi:MAG: tetratricopeptide (TPR) repeat protein [Planctomycetota bacterium]|jgi:tetratricopeptide (TPR) repeat protein